MRLIVVGDDGSDAAGCAVEWAARLAGERDAKLMAVHVTATRDDASDDQEIERLTVRERHPASGIMETAAELDADLIVLGRRGSGGFPSLPIGTTAHHVAGAGGRPVVVVPTGNWPPGEPLVQRVVLALDGLPGSAEAAGWAARNFGDAHLIVVHALELAAAFSEPDGADAALYERAHERAVALMRDAWCGPLVDASIAFETVVEAGGAAEVILDTAVRTAANLVIVGRRDHGMLRGTLGGVSQRVLAYAPCPAVIVQ